MTHFCLSNCQIGAKKFFQARNYLTAFLVISGCARGLKNFCSDTFSAWLKHSAIPSPRPRCSFPSLPLLRRTAAAWMSNDHSILSLSILSFLHCCRTRLFAWLLQHQTTFSVHVNIMGEALAISPPHKNKMKKEDDQKKKQCLGIFIIQSNCRALFSWWIMGSSFMTGRVIYWVGIMGVFRLKTDHSRSAGGECVNVRGRGKRSRTTI